MSKFKDLTEQKFNKLTVIKRVKNKGSAAQWSCVCDCGKETVASSVQLTGNRKKSCGCLSIKTKNRNKINYINKKFGKLLVINQIRIKSHLYLICKCDCGNIKNIFLHSILNGISKSCGCTRKKKIFKSKKRYILPISIGQSFGKLTVINNLPYRVNNTRYWQCRCSCGRLCVNSSYMLRHSTKSCKQCRIKLAIDKRPDLIEEWDFIKNTENIYEILSSSSKKFWWICKKCKNNWYTSIRLRVTDKTNCPFCRESKGEKLIKDILNDLSIKYVRQKTFYNCIYIGKLKFDFYLPDYNLCIEYQGE